MLWGIKRLGLRPGASTGRRITFAGVLTTAETGRKLKFVMQREYFRLYQEMIRCIAAQRARQHLSQERLALCAGLNRHTVRPLESGQVDATFTCVSRLMAVLGGLCMCFSSRSVEAEFSPDPEELLDTIFANYGRADWWWMVSNAGRTVAERRRLVGLSQEKLAQRAGISLNTVGRFERGEVDPSSSTIMAIYRTLEIERIEVKDGRFSFY